MAFLKCVFVLHVSGNRMLGGDDAQRNHLRESPINLMRHYTAGGDICDSDVHEKMLEQFSKSLNALFKCIF